MTPLPHSISSGETQNVLGSETLQEDVRQESSLAPPKEKRSIDQQATDIQIISRELGIVPGAILAKQNSCKAVTWGQRLLGKGKDSSNTHIAMVVSVNADNIEILEAHTRIGGLATKKITKDELVKFVKNGLIVMAHQNHTKEIATHVAKFARNIKQKRELVGEKIRYAIKRFITAPFLRSKDTERGRERTVQSLKSGRLMDSGGLERAKTICSEVGVEILKIGQISFMAKRDGIPLSQVGASHLQVWQEKGKVANLDSKRTTPARMIQEAKKMGFTCKLITQSSLQRAKDSARDEAILRIKNDKSRWSQ